MTFRGIERFSYIYAFLKVFIGAAFYYFYRVEAVWDFKEEKDKAYIFSPNHQNALMDALLGVFTRWEQFVVLGRGDIFKRPVVAFFLKLIKIMPVYRIRDGYNSLHKNDGTFKKTIDVLRTPRGLMIYPEANHHHHRSLRPLKKGLARIALQSQEELGDSREVMIVPVGIYYRHYFFMRSEALIHYGEPFSVRPFLELYKQNKARCLNALNAELADRMKRLFPHNPYKDNQYNVVELLADVWINNRKNIKTSEQVRLIKKAILYFQRNEHNPALMRELMQYRLLLTHLRIDDYTLVNYKNAMLFRRFLLLLLGFPIFAVGVFLNYLPYKLPVLISSRVEDKVFRATLHFGFSVLLLFPFFYGIYGIALSFIFKWYYTSLILIVFLALGAFSYGYFRFWKRAQRFFRLFFNEEKNLDQFLQVRDIVSGHEPRR